MPATPLRSKVLLGAMMFLQFAINGIWSIPLSTYLGTVGYSGTQIGTAYTTLAWAAIISPLFVGMIADRFFSSEKVLAVLNVVGGVLLYLASLAVVAPDGSPRLGLFFWALLAHCICYMPTWSLTSSIALAHVRDPGKEFPSIRVMGTIGWIVVSTASLVSAVLSAKYGWINIEKTVWPMWIGAGLSVATGVYDLFLPHTPPQSAGKKTTVGDILGLKALGLFRDVNFAVFAATSFLIMLPASFYWTFCNQFLDEIETKAPAFVQSIGQMSEMLFMFLLPFFLHRLGMKAVLLIGLAAWAARYVLFAFGMGPLVWMLYLALFLHGMCFAFVFITGNLYTDKKAPKELQASAQGLITLVTFGLGALAGTYLSGVVVDLYAISGAAQEAVKHDWQSIWLWPALMAGVISIVFLLLFRDKIDFRSDAAGKQADTTAA